MSEDPAPFAPDPDPDDDELAPLDVVVDILGDVVKLLNTADEILGAHRRAAGDDHYTIARLQRVSGRIGDAWTATTSARRALRSHE